MNAIIIRILLRYFAAFLIAKGFISPDFGAVLTGDPDIAMAVEVGAGTIVGAASEAWHFRDILRKKISLRI